MSRDRTRTCELYDHNSDRGHMSSQDAWYRGPPGPGPEGAPMSAQPAHTTERSAPRNRTHYLYLAVLVAVALAITVGFVPPLFAEGLRQSNQDHDPAGHLLHDRARRRLG